jgi:hypothetical protein
MGVQDDANRVLQELEKFGQTPNDSQRGRYSLDGNTMSSGIWPEGPGADFDRDC